MSGWRPWRALGGSSCERDRARGSRSGGVSTDAWLPVRLAPRRTVSPCAASTRSTAGSWRRAGAAAGGGASADVAAAAAAALPAPAARLRRRLRGGDVRHVGGVVWRESKGERETARARERVNVQGLARCAAAAPTAQLRCGMQARRSSIGRSAHRSRARRRRRARGAQRRGARQRHGAARRRQRAARAPRAPPRHAAARRTCVRRACSARRRRFLGIESARAPNLPALARHDTAPPSPSSSCVLRPFLTAD
jgi:hypothetical protein